jgi:type IV pilus assembly protein PilE
MEIMVVLIVLGVLTAIALPAYQDSMRKSRRTDAKKALMEVASRQEQYMLDRSTYTNDMEELGYATDPMVTEDRHYSVDRIDDDAICDVDSPTCYLLRATPRAESPQSEDTKCTSFTLSSTGAQTATGTDQDNCW